MELIDKSEFTAIYQQETQFITVQIKLSYQ